MAKIKIHQLKTELGIESKEIIAVLEANGITGKKPQSALDEQEEAIVRKAFAGKEAKTAEQKPKEEPIEKKQPEKVEAKPKKKETKQKVEKKEKKKMKMKMTKITMKWNVQTD